MKRKTIIIGCTVFIILFFSNCAQQNDFPALKGPYLGQKPPGMTPEKFAPGFISLSTNQEFSCAFTPDGKALYFTRRIDNKPNILFTEEGKNGWSVPKPAPFASEFMDHEPFVTYDGKRLFWGSERPTPEGEEKYAIWYVDRTETGEWGNPNFFRFDAMYVTATREGNLYFTGFDKAGDIFRMGYSAGKYQEAENVGVPINTEKNELHPLIAPDESWVIYDPWDESYGPYISFRLSDGSWTNPMRMDEKLQMNGYAFLISPDSKYLFFSSEGDIYWVDAKIIEELKPDELK
jgi:hypothetical protein